MWGVAGIIFASVVARVATYVWYEPVLLFKEYFGISSWIYFKGIFKSIIFTLGLMAAEALSINRFVPHSWVEFLIKCIGIGIMTVFLVLLFYAESPGLSLIVDKFKKERERI